MSKHSQPDITPAETSWQRIIAVCKTCDHADETLGKRIKTHLKEQGRRDVRVVTSTCLDVCPKRGTTCAIIGGEHPRALIASEDASVEDILETLLM